MQGLRTALFLSATAFTAIAMAACGGSKSTSSTASTSLAAVSTPAVAAASPFVPKKTAMTGSASTAAGAKIFTTNCSSCHQANGKGVSGTFPPLAGNAVVTGPAAKVILIVKNGLNGSIAVNGTTYNGQMPAWKGTLSASEIASVVTYVRSAWGNKASAVTVLQVTATK